MKNNELHNKKITEGFSTPKDYFESFEERFFGTFEAESMFPKEEGFKTPDAYFDGLENTLADKLFAVEQKETKVISMPNRKHYLKYISYAAAACIVVLITINFFKPTDTVNGSIFDNVANSEINTFIENDLIALNNYELMTAFEEENIDVSSIFEVELNETETIDYLENNADPYDLLVE
ncbi:hypothetical protein [Kordia jejudonensis]|uniref:hypothetical protein n=1 Tax=Kordia jejudonensis TaxID=1348245 RepID=UPI00062957EA|nr:hypothetical protein [Kordia jejudonensis]